VPSNGVSAILWFVAIVAMIPVVLWLLKRTPIGGAPSHGVMRHVAALPLSASQRLVTVEVGQGESRRWLVLGVTPSSITTLHTMEPLPDGHPGGVATGAAPSFAQLLGRLRKGADGGT
jgi:flagellar protein FliO/FliZ